MRTTLALLALLAAACARPTAPAGAPPTTARRAPPPKPGWVGLAPFAAEHDGQHRLYASGAIPLPRDEECPDARRLVEQASARARDGLVRALHGGADGVALGTLTGVEPYRAWYDAEALHVLVASTSSGALPTRPGSVLDGERPAAIAERFAEDARAAVEATGVCEDPHRRAAHPCCGPLAEMCHDRSRFDRRPAPGRCACGEGPPCLDDFACEDGACICRGSSCPCEILRCKGGQRCEDHRCF